MKKETEQKKKEIQEQTEPWYEVFQININGDKVSVEYEVKDSDTPSGHYTVCRNETIHEEFKKLIVQCMEMAQRHIEISLHNEEGMDLAVIPKTIRFLNHKKHGPGIRFKFAVKGLCHCDDPVNLTTPEYFFGGKYVHNISDHHAIVQQKLECADMETIQELKHEAFLYAYYGKREQPTVMEAAEAAENGGFKDERKE